MVTKEEDPERDDVATATGARLGGTVAGGFPPKDADGSPKARSSLEESEAAQILGKISIKVLYFFQFSLGWWFAW